MRSDPKSSAGWGGLGPDGNTNKPGCIDCKITCPPSSVPASKLLRPSEALRPKMSWMHGLRMSASTNRTFLPCWASTIAEFTLVVVFPSPGNGLVNKMVFGGAPNDDSRIDVRKLRYDSAICDPRWECVTSAMTSWLLPFCAAKGNEGAGALTLGSNRACKGTVATAGKPEMTSA